MAPGGNAFGQQKLGIDIEPVYGHGIGNQHLARQITWLDMAGLGQGVIRSHHQHLLIVKDGLKVQTRLEQRIGGDQHVDLIAEQRTDAAKLKLLLHVHIHIGPGGQIG